MIAIPQKQVRTLRTLFRRCGDASSLRSAVVIFAAGPDGLRVQCRVGAWAVERKFEGQYQRAVFGIPLAALADFEGSNRDDVTIDADSKDSVIVYWTDGNVRRQKKYKTVDLAKTPLLEVPSEISSVGDIAAFEELAEVCRSTAKDASRYVLNCIQLRGQHGDAVATDGRQMLISSGFSFPWKENVLVPRTKLFDAKEFAGKEPFAVARTGDHVFFSRGSWRLWLPIEKNGRFPDVDLVIPAASIATTSIQLADADAEFLAQTIPRLPGIDEAYSPVTVHCNGHVAVRAKADESAAITELSLDGSTVVGEEVLVTTDRNLLTRAASLGMKMIHFHGADDPALCTGDRRIFVWKPLSGDVLKPDANATVIHSGAQAPAAPLPQPVERKAEAMPQTVKPQKPIERPAPEPQIDSDPEIENADAPIDPIAEVEAIKLVLRKALGRVNRLSGSLRRQQRANKLVRSTLLSLRQLGEVG